MSIEEEVDKERKPYECDRIWLIRRTFLRKYWNEMPRDKLLCLSQLFININMTGCVYSDPVMEKVRRLGAGVMEEANTLFLEKKPAPPSSSPAPAAPKPAPSRPSTAAEPQRPIAHAHRNSVRMSSEDLYMEDKMKQIRIFLLQADYRASAMEMLNHATGRARSPWTQNVCDGVMRLCIANVLVMQQKFTQPEVDILECTVNAVVETFLHGGDVTIKNKMVHFNGSGPQDLYCNFLKRCLKKAEKLASGAKTYKALLIALEKVNLSLSQRCIHLQGWSQKVDIRIGDMLALSRVLSKGECVRPKLDKAIDDMCARISDVIASGSSNIVETAAGLELR